MDLFNLKELCPVCFEMGWLIVLKGKKNKKLLFHCPGCGVAWDKVPTEVNDIKTIKDFPPEGVIAPSEEDFISHGIVEFELIDDFKILDDTLTWK